MNVIFQRLYPLGIILLLLSACSPPQTSESEQGAASANQSDAATADKELLKQAQAIFSPLPTLEESRTKHPFTDEQVQLGKQLWYEPRLSLGNDISCNTCHGLNTYGVDNKPTSPGHNNAQGVRNSPTALNAFLLDSQFWDGRAKDVEEQAKGPLINPIEMAMPNHAAVEQKIAAIPGYAEQFQKHYADKGGKVSIDNIVHAIGAFERTLLTPSRWDKYLAGDIDALNQQERNGLKAFMNQGCIACHSGVNLGGDSMQKFGVVKGPYWDYINTKQKDLGLFDLTKKEEDKFVFRTPGLRNVAKTAPYFHSGSVQDLGKAVEVMAELQLNHKLTKQEIDDIVAFLGSTTGEIPADALAVPTLPK
ncbi:MAG: cytochrome-c peroxidase [Conchiformibius sp.]|nr:cytochrome-c peroxidase [Conchiformibius sp.]